MRQADLFAKSEGDRWHDRNKDKPRLPDPVLDAIDACKLTPKTVVEIGCGNGWRLKEIKERYGAWCAGYEPSAKAIKEKAFPNIFQANALEALPYIRKQFYDCIIFGFCLYLVDREDLMFIAAGADAALKDKGHIIIHDFIDGTYRVPYKHKKGIWSSYHMIYSNMWAWSPAYLGELYHQWADDSAGISVIMKDTEAAYPVREA